MSIYFHQQTTVVLQQRKVLKLFIPSIFKTEKKLFEQLDIIFCTDDYLLELNKTQLNHNYFTDIITFDLSESKSSPIQGEIYISIDRVRDNANTFNTTFKRELHRVIFHGVLHLCGYKDKKKEDIVTMRKMEEYYLNKYFN
jgi:probable rRNA maturation factor